MLKESIHVFVVNVFFCPDDLCDFRAEIVDCIEVCWGVAGNRPKWEGSGGEVLTRTWG